MRDRTYEAIERQVEAMGVEVFEVGLFKPCASPEMMPRTWDRATLLRSVGWLKYQNSQGRNVYIRPRGEHPLSLIDDLTREAVDRMKREGFEPCVVVETSPGNFQAWVNHGRVLAKAESTAAARALAARFGGDKGAADWRHFGRMVGLTNRKEKHRGADGRFPFVRLVESAVGRVYSGAAEITPKIAIASASGPRSPSCAQSRGGTLTIESFRARSAYEGDGNRIDLAFALYALSHGVSEHDVRAALKSRDLSKKGTEHRQVEYVERTIRKALAEVSNPRAIARTGR